MADKLTLDDILNMVRWWQNAFALWQWKIRVKQAKHADGRVSMKVDWVYHYRQVTLTVLPLARKQSRERAWHDVCHELLHVVFFPVEETLARDIEKGRVFDDWHDAMESCVDALTNALVELHPLGS